MNVRPPRGVPTFSMLMFSTQTPWMQVIWAQAIWKRAAWTQTLGLLGHNKTRPKSFGPGHTRPRPFSYLFNVAASRPAQMTTRGIAHTRGTSFRQGVPRLGCPTRFRRWRFSFPGYAPEGTCVTCVLRNREA